MTTEEIVDFMILLRPDALHTAGIKYAGLVTNHSQYSDVVTLICYSYGNPHQSEGVMGEAVIVDKLAGGQENQQKTCTNGRGIRLHEIGQ